MALATTATSISTLKIVLVENDIILRQSLRDTLEGDFGHDIVAEATSGSDMVQAVLDHSPDVVVFDVHLPGCCGLEALERIYKEQQLAAVAIAEESDHDLLRNALEYYYLSYIVKPVEPHQLEPAVLVAWAEYNRFRHLSDENATLKQTLQNRKVIERAKGVLMRRHRWSESEAYRRLQRGAMNRRTTMADLAQSVLNGHEMDLRDTNNDRRLRFLDS